MICSIVESPGYKVPPFAPVDVPVGARAAPIPHFGRNTSIPLGKDFSND